MFHRITHPPASRNRGSLWSPAISNLERHQSKPRLTNQPISREQSRQEANAPRDPQAGRGALGPAGAVPEALSRSRPITGSPSRGARGLSLHPPRPAEGSRRPRTSVSGNLDPRHTQRSPETPPDLSQCSPGPPDTGECTLTHVLIPQEARPSPSRVLSPPGTTHHLPGPAAGWPEPGTPEPTPWDPWSQRHRPLQSGTAGVRQGVTEGAPVWVPTLDPGASRVTAEPGGGGEASGWTVSGPSPLPGHAAPAPPAGFSPRATGRPAPSLERPF